MANSQPNSSKKHSELELLLYPHLLPRGSAAVVGDFDSEYLNVDTMLEMGFTASGKKSELRDQPDIYKEPYKVKSKINQNFWDPANFTSVDNKLPIYPRRTGFVDFDGMTSRPAMILPKANDCRFLTMNPFPSPVSSVKHSPKVFFDK